jgi:hypothetical protein
MSVSTITRVMALVTSAVTAAHPLAARADQNDPSGTGANEAATRVDIVLVGRARAEGSLAARIQSWFGQTARLSIAAEAKLVAERVLGPLPARHICVWLTLRSSQEARIYFAVGGETRAGTRYLVRDVPLEDGFDEIGSERVAQVVHSSVTALIEGSIAVAERVEIERALAPAAPPLAPAPTVPARPRTDAASRTSAVSPLLGAFYRGAFSGEEGFAHGPGVVLGASLEFHELATGLVARGYWALPRAERFDEVVLTFESLGALLGARGVWRVNRRFAVDVEVGAGLTWVSYDPKLAAPTGPVPRGSGDHVRQYYFVGFGIGPVLGPRRTGARLGLDYYPARTRYELAGASGAPSRRVAESSRLQPTASIELLFD